MPTYRSIKLYEFAERCQALADGVHGVAPVHKDVVDCEHPLCNIGYDLTEHAVVLRELAKRGE